MEPETRSSTQILTEISQEIGEVEIDFGQGCRESEKKYFDIQEFRYLKTLEEILDLKPGKVLDIGCLFLHFSMALSRLGHEVYGFDLPICISHPRLRQRQKKYQVKVKEGRLEDQRLPFRDKFFDYVVLAEVLEHLNFSPLPILVEIKRVLKKRGILILTTPNLVNIDRLRRLTTGQGLYPFLDDLVNKPSEFSHWKEYSMSELVKLLETSGFKVLEKKYFHTNQKYYRIGRNLLKASLETLLIFVPWLRNTIYVKAQRG